MYINYGDVNFFEYGCLVDAEHSDTEIKVLYCRPYDDVEDLFLFADCEVDITDSWIDRKQVMDYLGMTEENFDAIQFAIGCIDYYGVENFSSPYGGYRFSREDIEEQLKHYLIASDNLDITW
jgi:hypothetical protein